MANLLKALGGAAATYIGVEAGREHEQAKARRRLKEAREDENYELDKRTKQRADEKGAIEHGEFKRQQEEDAGAREAARRAAEDPAPAAPVAAEPASGGRTLEMRPNEEGTFEVMPDQESAGPPPVRGLSAAGAPGAAEATAPTSAPAEKGPNLALWARTAAAQRDYWIKRGQPQKAAKVMQDAINSAIAEREASYKFDTLPKIEAIRSRGLDAQALEGDAKVKELRAKAAEAEWLTAGLMWGHVINGNAKAAVAAFNASGVAQPGVQIVSIGQSADGSKIYLLDKDGQVAKDKEGQPLAYPRQLLDNLWQASQRSTLTLNKGQTVVQVSKEPGGGMTAKPIVTAPDPEAEGRVRTRKNAEDKAWGEALNKARDDSHRYLKDALGLTPNALGQVMNPDNAPIFERAQPLVEQKLSKLRDSGKRVDQVTATDIAKEALTEARDQLKREKMGALKKDGAQPAPGAGPSWRDVLQ